MDDPLAKYRKTPFASQIARVSPAVAAPAGETLAPDAAPDAYVAFNAKDKVLRLKIRRAMGPARAPGYAYLLDISSDGRFGKNFVLQYTFMTVLVRGKNLQAVVAALEIGKAEFIQQYDPELWPPPAEGDPVIEMIEVHATDPAIAAVEAKLRGAATAKP